MGKVAREAAKLLAEDLNRLKATLAKKGKTLDEFLEEMRIQTEETRKRTAEGQAIAQGKNRRDKMNQ